MSFKLRSIPPRTFGLFIVAVGLFVIWISGAATHFLTGESGEGPALPQRIYDEAGVISANHELALEGHLHGIFTESDLDVRVLTVKDTGRLSLEDFAIAKMQELGIGAEDREERGVLVVFDITNNRVRIEVGYGLEGYFPDSFINYLIRSHLTSHFSNANYAIGIELLLRILHMRIREAVLGMKFDPTVLEVIHQRAYLSGGAGASGATRDQDRQIPYWRGTIDARSKEKFVPQPTPEAWHDAYLDWLVTGVFDPYVDIFTKESQQFFAAAPMTQAYWEQMLLVEYGKRFKSDVRGNLAILYCVDSPLIGPYLLIKGTKGWQMNIVAEVIDTVDVVGGAYTWFWRGTGDKYTREFSDRLILVDGVVRIKGGDNRRLPTREP
jgi:hypothetical protein